MAKKRGKGYLGLGQIISIILCLFFGSILGFVERLLRGKLLGAILALPFILGWLFWWIDLITLIIHKDLTVLA